MESGAKRLRSVFWIVVAGVLASLVVAVPAASAAIGIGVYDGAQGQSTALESSGVLDEYIQQAGRAPSFVVDYRNVTDPLLTPEEVHNLESHGTGVMITWQLFEQGWGGKAITLPDLAAGRYDSALRAAAQQAKTLPFEVMIRFAHEMNGDWYPWGAGGSSGNVGSNYVDAWRHIVSVFRAEGATNVKWVWSPNVDYEGSYPFAQYFPGDEWVDYVALDGYNWGTSGEGADRWESLGQVFGSAYEKLTRLSSKPVILAETASSEAGGDKANWIRKGFLQELPQRFPRVQDVVWFDRDQEQDWRIDSSQSSLDAYREVVASTLYGGDVAPQPLEEEDEGKDPDKHPKVEVVHVPHRVGYRGAVAQRQRVQRRRFRVNGTIRYRLSDRGRVKLELSRRTRAGRYVTKAVLRRHGHAGRTRLRLARLGRRLRFHSGVYRVSVTAVGRHGAPASTRRAYFKVLKRR